MLFRLKDFPEEIYEIDHQILADAERAGLEHNFEKVKVDEGINSVINKIYRLRNYGWSFFEISYDSHTKYIKGVEEIEKANLEDLFFPYMDFKDVQDKKAYSIVKMDVIAKNVEHACSFKDQFENFLSKSDKDFETCAFEFHKEMISNGGNF
jgi:RNA processing factor Prp31